MFMIPEYLCIGKSVSDFFAVKTASVFVAMSFIVSFFYTYSGILGFSLVAVDILLFFAGVFVYEFISYSLYVTDDKCNSRSNARGFSLLVLFALCFIFWTYNPPMLGIFNY